MAGSPDRSARSRNDHGRALVNEALLVWPNSYSDDKPGFLIRGYYRDEAFTCRDCGCEEVWTATRQKWWYEVAKGGIFTKAIRCRACRRKHREHRAKSRKDR